MTIGELKAMQEREALPDSTKIVTYNPWHSGSYGECSIWHEPMIYLPEKDLFLETSIAKPGPEEVVIVVS